METALANEIYMYYNVLQRDVLLDLELRKIGNSVGFVIPASAVEREKLKLGKKYSVMVVADPMAGVRAGFGTLPRKGSTDKLLQEISDGWRD